MKAPLSTSTSRGDDGLTAPKFNRTHKTNATHAPESLVRAVEEKKSLDVCLSFLCGNEPQMMIQSEETQ